MFSLKFVDKVKESKFYLDGWKSYLTVQYGLSMISNKSFLVWQVKGTGKVFSVDLLTVNTHHDANYEEHFKLVLDKFRSDLIEWNKEGLTEPWFKKYWNDFKDLILI